MSKPKKPQPPDDPKKPRPDAGDSGPVIFRPWRRHPTTGQILWARDYGLKAWPIPVSELDQHT